MYMLNKKNITTGLGETFTLSGKCSDSNGPVDLTGHTVELVLRKASTEEIIGTYPAFVTDAQGNVEVKVSHSITSTWPKGKSAYVVVHTDLLGDKEWLVYGVMTVISGFDI